MKNEISKKFSNFIVNDGVLKKVYGGIDGGGQGVYCDDCGELVVCQPPKQCKLNKDGCGDPTRTKAECV
ncbi:MAG: hypothetical protein KDC85_05990 [Saprospiraceae bacterium]|nr:hypothetical protein [Saprospiraceae bacterium]MCB9323500.1 hypothetical protein [Lewinellaceae bacterium]